MDHEGVCWPIKGRLMSRDQKRKEDRPEPIKVERVPIRSDAEELSDREAAHLYRLEQARILIRQAGMEESE